MSLDERRHVTRLGLRIPLRFRAVSNPASSTQEAESLNISPQGAYFTTDFPLEVGTPVEMFLKMPRELTGQTPSQVRCIARVVHIQPNVFPGGRSGVGVHIERIEAMRAAERWVS